MRGPTTPSRPTISFAAVPYVKTYKPVQLGPWRLWPNTPEDWLRQAGTDLTWFMEMYRTRDGKPVGDGASLLTRTDGAAFDREDFRDAVVGYSTLAWLDGSRGADCWLFETWSLSADVGPTDMFPRVGKFSVNLTQPALERVLPSPYVSPITLRTNSPESITSFLRDALTKPQENSALRAFGQIHEVRFEIPYFTSLGNDIESLWTAFEALFLTQKSAPRQRKSTIRRLVEVFAPPKYPRRSEQVALAITEDLKRVSGVREESLRGIDLVLGRIWDARNAHSHAGQTEPNTRIDELQTNALDAGLQLFEYLLRIRIALAAGDDLFFLPRAVDHLNELFLWEKTVKALVELLCALDAKTWYPPGPAQKGELERMNALLVDLTRFDRVIGLRGDRNVAKARGFMRRVLNTWLKALRELGSQADDFVSLQDLIETDAEALKRLKADGLRGVKLEDALDDLLVQHSIVSEVWMVGAVHVETTVSPLGGLVSLSLWVRAYIRLHELFLGYALK